MWGHGNAAGDMSTRRFLKRGPSAHVSPSIAWSSSADLESPPARAADSSSLAKGTCLGHYCTHVRTCAHRHCTLVSVTENTIMRMPHNSYHAQQHKTSLCCAHHRLTRHTQELSHHSPLIRVSAIAGATECMTAPRAAATPNSELATATARLQARPHAIAQRL